MAFQTLAELNTGDVLPETWVDQVKENFEVLRGSAVTTLPTGFDNAIVRYKPNGAGSSPTWTLVFDEDLNGGVGAWAYVGGSDILSTAGGSFTVSTANLTTYTAYTGGPSIGVPPGVWDIVWSGIAQSANASWAVHVRLAVNGVGQSRYVYHSGIQALEGGTRGDPVGQRITLTTTSTITLQAATNNVSGVLDGWQIRMTPVELHP